MLINMMFTFSMGNVAVFSAERHVFEREHRSRMYGLLAYFMSKVLVELPFLIIIPFLYATATYFAVGLHSGADHFFICVVTLLLTANCGNAIGLWAASTFSELESALVALPLLLLPFIIFGGLFANTSSLPIWIRWLQWASPLKYAYTALMQNEFNGVTFNCPPNAVVGGPQCPQATGDAVVETYNAVTGGIPFNMLIVLAFWLGLWALAYLSFWRLIQASKGRVKEMEAVKHLNKINKEL